jgi:hypothetical protein
MLEQLNSRYVHNLCLPADLKTFCAMLCQCYLYLICRDSDHILSTSLSGGNSITLGLLMHSTYGYTQTLSKHYRTPTEAGSNFCEWDHFERSIGVYSRQASTSASVVLGISPSGNVNVDGQLLVLEASSSGLTLRWDQPPPCLAFELSQALEWLQLRVLIPARSVFFATLLHAWYHGKVMCMPCVHGCMAMRPARS